MAITAGTSEYTLTSEEHNEVAAVLTGPAPGYGPVDPTQAYAKAMRCFPDGMLAKLRDAATATSDSGITLITNLPVGQLESTPYADDEYYARSGRDRLSERVLLAVGESLGTIFAFENERNGVLLTNIVPTVTNREVESSNGSALLLPFHTEDIHQYPYNPDYVVLSCLRDEPGQDVYTNVLNPSMVLPDLPAATVDILRAPLFVTTPPPIYAGQQNRQPEPMPVVSGFESPQALVEFNDTRAITPDAEVALSQFKEACSSTPHRVELRSLPGQVAILDNRRVLHGRGAFVSSFGPDRRWLQRVKVKSGGMWPWRDLTTPSRPRTVRL